MTLWAFNVSVDCRREDKQCRTGNMKMPGLRGARQVIGMTGTMGHCKFSTDAMCVCLLPKNDLTQTF